VIWSSAHLSEVADQEIDEIAGFLGESGTPMAATYGTRTDEIAHRSRTQDAYDQVIAIQNNKAVQVVAAQASGIEDCLELLAMLGLNTDDLSPRLPTG
jgi:hypothetical protein